MNQITLIDGDRTIVFPAITAHGWLFHSLEGWYGQTGDKLRLQERPQGHGAFAASRAWRMSRAVSFAVAFRNGTPEEVEAAVQDLGSIGADGPITITVQDPLGITQRQVKVDTIPDVDRTRRYTGDMVVGLIAPDPRRYSLASDVPWSQTAPPSAGDGLLWPAEWPLIWPGGGSAGRVTVTNTGRAPSAPQFRLYGGFSSALITCVETGARIGLERPVPAGSVVTIDTAEHRATIDGQSDVSRWLRWREWELVPPLASRSFQFDVTDPSGSPVLEGRVLSAWW